MSVSTMSSLQLVAYYHVNRMIEGVDAIYIYIYIWPIQPHARLTVRLDFDFRYRLPSMSYGSECPELAEFCQ